MTVRTITLEQFQEEMKAQGTKRIEDVTFKCPVCNTLQSAQDLIDAGAGDNIDEVEKYIGFSCIGRFSPEPKRGCDWTLGGLFSLHKLEVITEDGVKHPRFELATDSTPEQTEKTS